MIRRLHANCPELARRAVERSELLLDFARQLELLAERVPVDLPGERAEIYCAAQHLRAQELKNAAFVQGALQTWSLPDEKKEA